jgi:SAM-dependent methyltransferase
MMDILEVESAKYDKMWNGRYKVAPSPGLAAVPAALEWFGPDRPASVIDFGCGSGAAMDAMASAGMQPRGVDITNTGFQSKLPLVVAPLWDIPDFVPPADNAFSVDVLEHLPPDKVEAAIGNMARLCLRSAFLRISLREDYGGKKEGLNLHLTIKPVEWWVGMVEGVFNMVGWDSPSPDVVQIRCRRRG